MRTKNPPSCRGENTLLFHDKRHPQEMGVPEVRAFLAGARFSGLAGERVEAATAIRLLHEVVLHL